MRSPVQLKDFGFRVSRLRGEHRAETTRCRTGRLHTAAIYRMFAKGLYVGTTTDREADATYQRSRLGVIICAQCLSSRRNAATEGHVLQLGQGRTTNLTTITSA